MDLTNGKTHDLESARPLVIPPGSCIVFDCGYNDYSWYGDLDDGKLTFVIRIKSNANAYKFGYRRKPETEDVLLDYKIKLS